MYALRSSHTVPCAVAIAGLCTQVYNTGYIALLLRCTANPSGVFSHRRARRCSFGGAEHTTMVHIARKRCDDKYPKPWERPLEPRAASYPSTWSLALFAPCAPMQSPLLFGPRATVKTDDNPPLLVFASRSSIINMRTPRGRVSSSFSLRIRDRHSLAPTFSEVDKWCRARIRTTFNLLFYVLWLRLAACQGNCNLIILIFMKLNFVYIIFIIILIKMFIFWLCLGDIQNNNFKCPPSLYMYTYTHCAYIYVYIKYIELFL